MADAILGPPLARGQNAHAALLCGDRTVTYGELDRAVNRAGNAFKKLGIGVEDRVLMLVSDTPEFYFTHLGSIKIGAVPVGLNLRLAESDLAFIAKDSGARFLVVGNEFLDLARRALKRVEDPPALITTDEKAPDTLFLAELMADASPELESAMRNPTDPAFWMYTSGTTGTPKAAVHCHRTIFMADSYLGEILQAGPDDRIFCSSKLFFAFALGHCYFGALRLGATAILYPDWPSPEAVAEVVERYRPTIMFSVPTFYRNLLQSGAAKSAAFKQIRHYVSAGEKLPETIFERWRETTGQPIKDGIGATETCFLFLANRGGEYRPGSCGVPVPGAEVKLVGEDGEEITEPNKPGILWVRTLSVAGGYWNMPDKTRAAFKNGWYRTGDMFERDADGWYWHAGRGDDMLKVSGQWVSPGEIEDYVLRIPKVQDAAVVGVPNEDGLTRLALFLVAPDAKDCTEDLENEIRDTLTTNLSIYKCPRRMFFMDGLPMTATGKVQRFALRQMVADGSVPTN